MTSTAPSARRLLGTLAVTGALIGGLGGALVAGRLSAADPVPAPAAQARDAQPRAKPSLPPERSATARPTPLPVKASPARHHHVHHAAKRKRQHAAKRRAPAAATVQRVKATVTTTAATPAPAATNAETPAPVVTAQPVVKATPVVQSPRASGPKPEAAPVKPKPQPDAAPTGTFDDSG